MLLLRVQSSRVLFRRSCLYPRLSSCKHLSYPRHHNMSTATTKDESKDNNGKFKIAALQFRVGADKNENLNTAETAIDSAVQQGAQLVVLPECFNGPYSVASFAQYAEIFPTELNTTEFKDAPSLTRLSAKAKEHGIYLVGGSIPEVSGDQIFNTSPIFNDQGQLIARHRKIHLFDIDIPEKITFQESKVLSPGKETTVFATPWGATIGVGICYDIRFPELAFHYTKNLGCNMLIYPGAFNTVTGPKHWTLLQRARAVDYQCYVITASPARSLSPEGYQAWGHSSVISPWGEEVATCDEKPAIVIADVDINEATEARSMIPVRDQRFGQVSFPF